MNYGDLKAKVADFLNRTDLVSVIPTFIEISALKVQRKFNFKVMEGTAEHLLADKEDELQLPPSYKTFRQAWVFDNSDRLYRMVYLKKVHFDRAILTSDPDALVAQAGDFIYREQIEGGPVAITEWGGRFLLYPAVSNDGVGKTLSLDYYRLVNYNNLDDSYEDDLLEVAWDALLFGSLVQAKPYLGPEDAERVSTWLLAYGDSLKDLEAYSIGKDFLSEQAPRMGK